MYDLEKEIKHERYKIKLREEIRKEKNLCEELKKQNEMLKKQIDAESDGNISLLHFVTFFLNNKSDVKEIDIINLLLRDGFLIDVNTPSYKSVKNNLITTKASVVNSVFGKITIGTTYITSKGQKYFMSKYGVCI